MSCILNLVQDWMVLNNGLEALILLQGIILVIYKQRIYIYVYVYYKENFDEILKFRHNIPGRFESVPNAYCEIFTKVMIVTNSKAS